MNALNKKKQPLVKPDAIQDDIELPGYPIYPVGDDIYARYKEEMEINPEDVVRMQEDKAVE